jgi:hypothetical protein
MTDELYLKVWKLHSQACRIEPAEKTLHGTANEGANKWCGPYNYANSLGWWLYPPAEVEIIWLGGHKFNHRQVTEYTDEDYHTIRKLIRPSDKVDPNKWCMPGGRTKYNWGAVDAGVVQLWTGCIFQTPPGWCLQIRSPVNTGPKPYYVMEGVLETDWMQYDIWINLVFTQQDEWVTLKDEWPPLAQLIPVRREAYEEDWKLQEEFINRNSKEANTVFEYYIQYNHKKFGLGGRQALSAYDPSLTKDSTTYYRERKRLLPGIEKEAKRYLRPRSPGSERPSPGCCSYDEAPETLPATDSGGFVAQCPFHSKPQSLPGDGPGHPADPASDGHADPGVAPE